LCGITHFTTPLHISIKSPTESTTAPTYIFSTPYPTVSKDTIAVDQAADIMGVPESSFELSMSMNFDEDNKMSMFMEDFQQFDVDFMSMTDDTVDHLVGTETADETMEIIEDTTTKATAFEAQIQTGDENVGINLDDVDVPVESENEPTNVAFDTTTPAVATKPLGNTDCTEATCALELSPDLLLEYQVIVPDTTTVDECDGCQIQVKMTFDGIAWLGFGLSTDGGMVGGEAVM
jgi:hypothetical protein